MKIEIWSDFVCPFCYIGKRKMEMALDQFPQKDNVVLVYKSYELDPNSEKNSSINIHDLLVEKYDMSIEKAKQVKENVNQHAQEVGLTYHLDTIQYTNTLDAHRLVQYATKRGKGSALTEALLHAYFTDSKNLSDHMTLAEIGVSVGLEKDNILELLKSRKYRRNVRDDEEEANEIGVERVPFFVFNETYGISGVQSIETFLEVMTKVQEEGDGPQTQSLNSHHSETSFCTGEGCNVNSDEG